jgi:hypothetical protein
MELHINKHANSTVLHTNTHVHSMELRRNKSDHFIQPHVNEAHELQKSVNIIVVHTDTYIVAHVTEPHRR